MAFANGWGGITVTTPNGTTGGSWGSGSHTVSGPASVDSNAGNIGTAKTFADYTTSACGVDAYVSTSGGCSGSASDSGGCGDANASTAITINNNATTACTINYSGNADSGNSASASQVIKIKQYVEWSSTNPGYKLVGDPAYTVTAFGRNAQTGTSGIAPTYTSNTTSVCTVNSSSGSVTNVARGLCKITASVASNGNWTSASGSMQWYVRDTQSITVTTSPPASASIGASFNVAATASSGLTVQITTSGSCSGSGSGSATITANSGGTCNVHFNQSGNNYFAPASQVTQSVTVNKQDQTITFGAQSDQNYSPSGTFPLNPLATASSGLPVSYTSMTTGVCTLTGIDNDTVQIVSAGTCTIRASQSGDANYNPAPYVYADIRINNIGQTITVTTAAPVTIEAGNSFSVAATASSGLGVAITVSGTCSIASGGTDTATIDATSKGTCTVYYNQPGNTNYTAAAQISNVVDVTLLTQSITLSQVAPTTIPVGDPFTVTASSTSGLDVAVTVTGGCLITSGGTNTATIKLNDAFNPCTVHYNQAGNVTYEPAVERTNIVEAYRENQDITVTTPAPAKAANGATFSVAATASSGLDVAITTGSNCSGSGTNSATITMNTATSSCTVYYNQGGDANFHPATQVTNVVADGTAPVITEVKAVASVTSSKPRYTFNSNEVGNIVYSGSCASSTTSASAGDNLIVFDQLAQGTYSDCTLLVKDAANNASNVLSLGTFDVVPGMTAFVKPTASGAGDCSSWVDACDDIQAAINIAAVDEVWLAKGVYHPSSTITLKGGVSVYGGFAGTETSLAKADPGTNLTVISGDVGADDVVDSKGLVMYQADINGTNLGRIFTASGLTTQTDQKVILSGVILNAASGSQNGAALLVDNSSVALSTSQVIAVKGATGGAVSVVNGGKFTADEVTFLRNESTGAGGVLASTGDNANSVTIRNSLFDSNTGGTAGGAIHHVTGQMKLINSTLYNNHLASSTGKGGAIDLAGITYPNAATIKYVTVVGNRAGTVAAADGRGGAINVDTGASVDGTVTLSNSLVLDNQAATGANIADMDKVTDGGYNIVGYNGVSGMVYGSGNNTYEFTGTSVTAPTVLLEDILETTLAANGGVTANLRLKSDSYAKDRIPNIHADCEVTGAVGEDQRGYTRPDATGNYCDVGALEYDSSLDQCQDTNRQTGFYAGFYPQTNTFCYAGNSLSMGGSINPFFLYLLGFVGLLGALRLRGDRRG